MRRLPLTTALAVGLFALACTDGRQEGPTEPASTAAAAKPCTGTLDDIQSQICALFGPTDNLKSAWDFYNNIKTKLTKDPAFAQARAVDLVNFTFKLFYDGKLLDPPGTPNTQQGAVNLTCSVLGFVGSGWTDCATDLGAGLGTTSSSPHSIIQVCGPAGCLVRPADKHSGVSVPPDACPTLCIISVDPIPPNQGSPRDGPLSTNLDQYPLFRELKLVAAFDEFDEEVIVGICHLSPNDGGPFAPPDAATEARLRLAHPHPDGEGGIEILDKVAATFLDCSDLFADNDEFTPPPEEEGSVGSLQLRGFASAAQNILTRAFGPVLQTLFLPEPVEATVVGGCCLGGAATKFSPWAAVDPVSFFSDPGFGTAPFDPGGKFFFTGEVLSWQYSQDGSSIFGTAYPAVQVFDEFGNPEPGVDITVSLVPVDGSTGTLSGTFTRSTSEGNPAAGPSTAVFDNLTIDQPGDYRLRFTVGTGSINSGSTIISGVFTVEEGESEG